MVIFQGNNRVFDKILEVNANNNLITTEIYGVTSYNDLTDVILTMYSKDIHDILNSININNLGPKDIKYITDYNNNYKIVDFNFTDFYTPFSIVYNSDIDCFILVNYFDADKFKVLDIEYDNLETFNNVATATSEEVLAVIPKDTLDKLFEFIRTGKSIRIKGSDNNEPSTYYTMFPISQSRSENSYSITLMIGTIIYTYTFTSDYALTINKIQLATSIN